MSTPSKALNLITKVKALSPISPKLPNNNISAIKKLNNHSKPIIKHLQVPENVPSHTLNFSEFNKKKLFLSTPEKTKIQHYGLEGKNNLKILGYGTFGNVVRGNYKGLDVAIKIIKIKNENNQKYLINRDQNALNLNQENIVKTIDVVINLDKNYGIVVMEYLSNSKSLHSVLLNGPNLLTFSKIKKYATDICNGLKYCHQHKTLHLDLKPKNILVCSNDICKICDFGNSMIVGETLEHSFIHGTPAYTAPEIYLGKDPSPGSDIYSLGIVLWQLQEKDLPYKGITCPEILIYKVVKFELRPKINCCKEVEYTKLFKKCWSPQIEERPSIEYVLNKIKSI